MSKKEVWEAAEKLTSPDQQERRQGLDYFAQHNISKRSPLIGYLIAARITDPEIEIRYHAIQLLGSLLDGDQKGTLPADDLIRHVHGFLRELGKDHLVGILEVATRYLSSEDNIFRIFKLCSYAGRNLSGIVNDRKVDLDVRKKAIYFAGKVGFLETRGTIERLVDRVEEHRSHSGKALNTTPSVLTDMEVLYPFAVAALNRLNGNSLDDQEGSK